MNRRGDAMPLRTVTAVRYVTPLREGGSLPAIVEGDDAGLYVLKFRGAGQGPNALIAEIVAGELARAAGLDVPEIVLIDLPADLARTEPDPEIQDLMRASAGLNVALDYLPGAAMFDPVVDRPEAALAAAIVWLDALTLNVDRTARNPNLLMWHRRLWLIDHGAALYFHHAGSDYRARVHDAFPMVAEHVLLPFAAPIESVDALLAQRLTPAVVAAILRARRMARSRWGVCIGAGASRGLCRFFARAPCRAAGVRDGGRACPNAARMTMR